MSLVLDKKYLGHLRRIYGLTGEQYESLYQRQSKSCAICRRPASSFKIRLSVDHDHKTGEIFGLLCTYCNRMVIGRERRAEIYARAGEYLTKGTGWFVPKRLSKKKKKK